MASRTRSHTVDSIPTFEAQNLLKELEKEVCSFDNADIAALRASGAFPVDAIICPFDREVRSDVSSDEWMCFLAYPFSIGLRYPFPSFISGFFELIGLSYAQTIPMVWRVLVTLDKSDLATFPIFASRISPSPIVFAPTATTVFLFFNLQKSSYPQGNKK
ncbi:hypothetical protein HanRHA438_Chr08g0362381 [Helianthus annuus]|nr:hypothetical protein HanRHA438_Chr08g0362381 [Helianthus annuus]